MTPTMYITKSELKYILTIMFEFEEFEGENRGHMFYDAKIKCFDALPRHIRQQVVYTRDTGEREIYGLHLLQVLAETLGCQRPKYTMNKDKRAVILTQLIVMKLWE